MSPSMPMLEGDPQALKQHVTQYKLTAEAIQQAASDLAAISNSEGFVSEAIVKIHGRASSAATEASAVYDRYIVTANALEAYAVSLEEAQGLARSAIAEYVQLESEAKSLAAQAGQLADQALFGGPDALALLQRGAQATAQLEQFASLLLKAEANYATAVAIKEAAALKAAAAIAITAVAGGLDDTPLDVITDAFKTGYEWAQKNLAPILEQLLAAANKLIDILSTVSLVLNLLALVPGLDAVFAPLAAGVDLALTVLTAVALVSSVMLVLLGQRSLGQVVSDAITFAASKVLGKLGDNATGKIDDAIGAEDGSFMDKLVGDGVDSQTDKIQSVFDKDISVPAGTWLDNQHLQLFPSSSGPSWNAPPTIQVAPLSLTTSTTASSLASGIDTSLFPSGSAQPVLVSVGS